MSSLNFAKARKEMLMTQLKNRGINDRKVLKVMGKIPREKFVPQDYQFQAYEDGPLPIGRGQTISQPYMVALMTQLLALKGEEKVLEVGTGSGYQAAILACLAKKVYTIERHRELFEKARQVFQKLSLKNIEAKWGNGFQGWPEKGPFEAIIVTAAAEKIPPSLVDQLKDGGRLVAPVGSSFGQRLLRITKKGRRLEKEDFGGCVFVPLIKKRQNLWVELNETYCWLGQPWQKIPQKPP